MERKPVGLRRSGPGFDLRKVGPSGPVITYQLSPEELAELEARLPGRRRREEQAKPPPIPGTRPLPPREEEPEEMSATAAAEPAARELTRETLAEVMRENPQLSTDGLAREFGLSPAAFFRRLKVMGVSVKGLRQELGQPHPLSRKAEDQPAPVELTRERILEVLMRDPDILQGDLAATLGVDRVTLLTAAAPHGGLVDLRMEAHRRIVEARRAATPAPAEEPAAAPAPEQPAPTPDLADAGEAPEPELREFTTSDGGGGQVVQIDLAQPQPETGWYELHAINGRMSLDDLRLLVDGLGAAMCPEARLHVNIEADVQMVRRGPLGWLRRRPDWRQSHRIRGYLPAAGLLEWLQGLREVLPAGAELEVTISAHREEPA